MKKLILIRHGETDYTLQERYCGHKNIPLNSKGIEQADYMRLKLRNVKVDRIYSSDLRRALQTAEIIFKEKTVFIRKSLREIDFGQFCGLTFEEADRLYPDVYKAWLNNPVKLHGFTAVASFSAWFRGAEPRAAPLLSGTDAWVNIKMPAGESLRDLAKRVTRCFRNISDRNAGKNIAIITHGGPIRIILLNLLRLGLDKFWDIEQDVAALNIVEFKNEIPKILKINDTSASKAKCILKENP